MAKTGVKAKAYVNIGGSYASPTWVEATLLGDVQFSGQWSFADAPTRETPVIRGARTNIPLGVSGKMRNPHSAVANAVFDAFDDAFFNSSTTLDVMFLDKPKDDNTARGVRSEWELTNWSEDQALGNVLYKDFELKPALATNPPKRVKVTAGSPVFSDFA